MILRNVLSNWAALIIAAAASIVLTPMLIHGLGHFYYGLWILVASLVDYYGLLDVGIRATMQRFVARLHATGERDVLNETYATGLGLMVGVAVLIMGATALIVPFIGGLGSELDATTVRIARHLLLWLAASVAVTLPARLLGAYLCGLERFDLYNLANISATLARTVLMAAAIVMGLGVVGVAAATLGASIFLFVLNWFLVRRVDREARLEWRRVSLARAREMFNFSLYVFLSTIGDYLRRYTDALVIGRVLGVALITPFNVATRLTEYMRLIIAGAAGPFMPPMSALDGRRCEEDLRRLFVRATRLIALPVSLMAWLIVLDGSDLILLWLGDGFQESVRLTLVLLIGFVIYLAQMPSTVLLVAKGRHRPLAFWTLGEGVVKLLLSIYWARRYGLLGVALSTTAPMLVVKLFVQPWYVLRVIELPVTRYLVDGFARPLMVNLVFFLVCLAGHAFGPKAGVVELIAAVAWQGLLFAALTYTIGLTAETRTGLLRSLARLRAHTSLSAAGARRT